MRLTDGRTEITVTIEGYQFPEIENEKWDANWLMVRVDVAGPDGTWAQLDPGLLTWEVEALARWLETIASADPPESTAREFLEPFLRFDLVDADERRLKVSAGYGRLSMEVPVIPQNLRECVTSLRQQLERFPRRGP